MGRKKRKSFWEKKSIAFLNQENYGKLVLKNLFKKGKDIDILIKWLLIITALIWFVFYGLPMIFTFFI